MISADNLHNIFTKAFVKKALFYSTLLVLACAGIFPRTVNAVAPTQTQPNLTVSPYIKFLTVYPGSKEVINFILRDNAQTSLSVGVKFTNFQSSGQKDGVPQYFDKANGNENVYPQTWFSSKNSSLVIKSQQEIQVPVTLTVPSDATPGGHYGGVEFSSANTSVNAGLNLVAKIAVPILITVPGNITNNLKVESFTVNPTSYQTVTLPGSGCINTNSCKGTFSLDVANTGNEHEAPVGYVNISDMFGRQVASIPINQPSGDVLPTSERIYTVHFTTDQLGWLKLGTYTATLNVVYSNKRIALTAQTSFFVINWAYAILLVLLLIGLLLFYVSTKKKNQRY
jgi:hypothetical protein